ncbi:RNA helicase [Moumouvirus goulette]|uniref:RNA helicase n=1 Tax=Moumouvirus goulette TaxID=1247379 RepID=M1PX00_9VIRU|nr:RNA helicase [Moumouvirus goulette]AGF85287.1 RNA helicase [Moumouvirus goulette]
MKSIVVSNNRIINVDWSYLSSQNYEWIKNNDDRYRFIQDNLLNWIFPNLNDDDKLLLLNSLVKIINMIYLKFSFHKNNEKPDNILWNQLIQNRLLDLRALLAISLPYINDTENDDKKRNLRNLQDLYLEQDETGAYFYTNSQYNRCIRHRNNKDIQIFRRPFLREYFLNHIEMLLMSIESCSNKLYVNWVDVLPMKINKYQNTKLYLDTVKKFNSGMTRVEMINTYIDPRPGLSFQDIYNVMANHLFNEIKNHKWLIYDININGIPVSYIRYLENIFNFNIFWEGKLWSQLTENEVNNFIYSWNTFFNSADVINTTILHHFYFFFSKYHINSRKLIRQGKLILNKDPSDDEENQEENIRITPETTRYARTGMQNIPIEEIYIFMYNQLSSFKKSWYYYMIKISNREYLSIERSGPKNLNEDITGRPNVYTNFDIYITPKNIYNYCKSMVHFINPQNKYLQIPSHWQSLTPNFIEMILIRLLDIPDPDKNNWSTFIPVNWFNINKYIRRTYPSFIENDLPVINYLIHLSIKSKLIDVIFESLIYHGLLTDFYPNPTITDNSIIETSIGSTDDRKKTSYKQKQMRKQYFTGENLRDYESNAYYFITNEPFKQLPGIISRDYPKNNNYEKSYFDFLTSDQIWTFTYAMNWVSQINFYHHYNNTRVLYITGATGVGKSTQVPKLLMYSQKMIDFNPNGKIVCTQPRVTPTVANAETISRELGVPIRIYSSVYDKNILSSKYDVQFKHQKEQHINRNADSFLRIVTDGTLLEEMANSLFLTKSTPDPNALDIEENKLEFARIFNNANIYDIVIVDEAHEHNANMDMILTLARDITYLNNSVKLVIVSATMEDDEPIYRRYYRTINDNRAFPLSAFITTNLLDRANMDRRIHISPPGRTTQFNIQDIYLSKAESDSINTNNFVDFGINKTIQIANSTTEKNILLFLTGQADIRKAIQEINSNTPSNIIALGYFGEMTDEMKDFISKIHETLPTYTRYKEDVDLDEKDITRRVSPGTYTRAVIIATNVAEASITLKNLRYVVDTGYAKVVVFDPLESISKTLTLPISNSSATQRRGRVGRLESGVVYHMYDENKIKNNKTAYKIADSNIRDLLVKFIKADSRDTHIVSPNNDINAIRNLKIINGYKSLPRQNDLVYKILKNPKPFLSLLTKNYLYIPDPDDANQYFTYYGKTDGKIYSTNELEHNLMNYLRNNHDDYDFQESFKFLSRAYTGYDDYILEDQKLKFYIIHPDENVIQRNLYTGQMIGIKNNPSVTEAYYYYLLKFNNIGNQTKIDYSDFNLLKYNLAISDAKSQMLVVDIPINYTNKYIQYTNISEDIHQYVDYYYINLPPAKYDETTIKSMFLSKIREIQSVYSLNITNDVNNLLWYSYGIPFNVQNDILALMLMIETSPDINQWILRTKSKESVNKFFNLHNTSNGDIYFLWNLWLEIKKILNDNDLLNFIKIDTNLQFNFTRYKNKYLRGEKISYQQFLILDNMYKSGKLNTNDEFYFYLDQINPNFSEILIGTDIIDYLNIIARDRLINPEKLIDLISEYLNNYFIISKTTWIHQYQLENKMNDEDNNDYDILEWAKINLNLPGINDDPYYEYSDWDKIFESYTRAFSTNVVKNMGSFYLKINNGLVIPLSSWSRRNNTEKSFFKNKTEYIIYHNTDAKGDMSNIIYLSPIKLEWVFRLNPLYYYYLLYGENNILEYLKTDTNIQLARNLIESYKNIFDVKYLFEYLNRINDPLLLKIIRSQIS